MEMITAAGLKAEIAKKGSAFIIVDLRDPYVYREKHIPEAVNVVKGGSFVKDLAAVVPDKDAVVVLYDEHEEYNSDLAEMGAAAEAAGYTKVHALKDGFLHWLESGGTVWYGTES
jgi:rhodanese-related sulfurtransferase